MHQMISENLDSSVHQTIANKEQDTALIEQCPKSSSQYKSAKLLQFHNDQTLQATAEPNLTCSKHEYEDFNSFYEGMYSGQLHRASIKYNQWLHRDHYSHFKARQNSDETIQEPNNSRYPDDTNQCPDFVDKSESVSNITCCKDDPEILDNGNYCILEDDSKQPTDKKCQGMDCPKIHESLESISQKSDSAKYEERLKAHEFPADEKHAYEIPIQIPRVLEKYRYVPEISSKQSERTNMMNSFAESDSNYEVLEENCASINLNRILSQKRIVCLRQPKRLTDYPDTHCRYSGISEDLEKQAGSTRFPLENNNLENKNCFTCEVSNQQRMTSLRKPESFQNHCGMDFGCQHPCIVDGLTNIKDKEKQEDRHYMEVLCEVISPDRSEYLSLYPERNEHWPGFHQKNLAESKDCSEMSRMTTCEMREGLSNKYQKNKHYHFSLDRKCTSKKEPDSPAHLQINMYMNEYDHQVEKCPNHLNSQKQPPLKDLSYPKSKCELSVYDCSDHSCKCKDTMLCLVLKPNHQANYRGSNDREHTGTKPYCKNGMKSNPEIRGLSKNYHKKDYSLRSNYWRGKYPNVTEKSDPNQSDLLECKPKLDLFSVRDPNDFITTEEAAKIVKNLRLQSQNSIEFQSNTDNLKKFDDGNASSSKELYETIDNEPDYKVLSSLSLPQNTRLGSSITAQKSHNIFKKIFRKFNKKSTFGSKYLSMIS